VGKGVKGRGMGRGRRWEEGREGGRGMEKGEGKKKGRGLEVPPRSQSWLRHLSGVGGGGREWEGRV